MIDLIKRIIAFLLPIVGKAALQTAADVITDVAYPERRPYQRNRRGQFTSYNRLATPYSDFGRLRDYAEKDADATMDLYEDKDEPEQGPGSIHLADDYHDVLLVAFDISGPDVDAVKDFLLNYMPVTGEQRFNGKRIYLDAYWIADDTAGTSDCDSAVFVNKGDQVAARGFLRRGGLAGGTGSV